MKITVSPSTFVLVRNCCELNSTSTYVKLSWLNFSGILNKSNRFGVRLNHDMSSALACPRRGLESATKYKIERFSFSNLSTESDVWINGSSQSSLLGFGAHLDRPREPLAWRQRVQRCTWSPRRKLSHWDNTMTSVVTSLFKTEFKN